MPIETEWLIENRVIFQRLSGEVTHDDLNQSRLNTEALMKSVTDTLVFLITDQRAVTKFPTSVREIAGIFTAKPPERLAWTVIVSDDMFARFVSSTVTQMIGVRVRAFKTMDEACAFVIDQDAALAPYDLPALLGVNQT